MSFDGEQCGLSVYLYVEWGQHQSDILWQGLKSGYKPMNLISCLFPGLASKTYPILCHFFRPLAYFRVTFSGGAFLEIHEDFGGWFRVWYTIRLIQGRRETRAIGALPWLKSPIALAGKNQKKQGLKSQYTVSYTHLTLPTIYSV